MMSEHNGANFKKYIPPKHLSKQTPLGAPIIQQLSSVPMGSLEDSDVTVMAFQLVKMPEQAAMKMKSTNYLLKEWMDVQIIST